MEGACFEDLGLNWIITLKWILQITKGYGLNSTTSELEPGMCSCKYSPEPWVPSYILLASQERLSP
jgi:hypothetical protein